ncbi:MAG: metalloregulator ArsR/SmtB family transcription factor [Pseudomonadota bacterium]
MADFTRIVESRERAEVLADVLKGIGHPARLRIVAALCRSRRNVGELAGLLGLRQSLVSQHLSLLRLHGLVASQKNGTSITYSLKEKRLKKLIECLAGCKQHPAVA